MDVLYFSDGSQHEKKPKQKLFAAWSERRMGTMPAKIVYVKHVTMEMRMWNVKCITSCVYFVYYGTSYQHTFSWWFVWNGERAFGQPESKYAKYNYKYKNQIEFHAKIPPYRYAILFLFHICIYTFTKTCKSEKKSCPQSLVFVCLNRKKTQ